MKPVSRNSKIINLYINEIKNYLPICKSNERKFLNDLKSAIIDFSIEINELTYDELINQFGEPKDLAANYLIEADSQYLSQTIRYSHRIKMCITLFSCAIIISFCAYILFSYRSYNRLQKSYISREVITIDEQ